MITKLNDWKVDWATEYNKTYPVTQAHDYKPYEPTPMDVCKEAIMDITIKVAKVAVIVTFTLLIAFNCYVLASWESIV